MDRLHEIEVFIAVAEAGSFAKAAQRLRLSPPAVTRAVAALESRLGARVFNRTTRSLAITEIGQSFLANARRLVAELDAAERDAVGKSVLPNGHLTVTASVTFGRSALAPIIGDFLAQYPLVNVSVLLLDRVTNLVDEGIDLAVRIGPLADSSMVDKRIGTVKRILVASPDYLARRGTPGAPDDLRHHAMIAFTGLMPNREWRFHDGRKGKDGRKDKAVSFLPRFEINDAVAAIASAEAGDGITIALSYMVATQIRQGKLVTLLDEWTPMAAPVHLVFPQTRLVAPKLRAFVDFAAPRLKRILDDAELPQPQGD